jgi:hypothetical protein
MLVNKARLLRKSRPTEIMLLAHYLIIVVDTILSRSGLLPDWSVVNGMFVIGGMTIEI